MRREFRDKCWLVVLWMFVVIYPAVSRVVLQMMNCKYLDHGESYLYADMRISCNSEKYKSYIPLITLAFLIYPIGVPALFFYLLYKKRHLLRWSHRLGLLYHSYEDKYWWFEVYELSPIKCGKISFQFHKITQLFLLNIK